MSEPARLLVVSPWGSSNGYSGPTTFMNRLFAGVKDAYECEIDLIRRDSRPGLAPPWASRVINVATGTSELHFGRRAQVTWALAVRGHLRRCGRDYGFIHLHGVYLPNVLALLATGASSPVGILPVLQSGDLALPRHRVKRQLKRGFLAPVTTRAAVGFALSDGIATELAHAGVPPERIVRLNNVAFSRAPALLGARKPLPGGAVRLGFVGKMGPVKNPLAVLESVALLRRAGTDATACFVGPYADDDYRRTFEAAITSLGLHDSVQVMGFRTDVADLMVHDMDVFVLPSRAEGLPGALAEAMAAGLPSLVTDVGSMREHVEASGSGVVIDGTAGSIATSTALMLSNSSLTSRRSDRAIGYAHEHFSVGSVASAYGAAVGPYCRWSPRLRIGSSSNKGVMS